MASGSGDGVSLSVGTLLGNMEGAHLPGNLKDNNRYIKRDVKIPCKRVSLSIRAPLGKQEGIRLPGLFEKKRKVYSGSLLEPREY